MFMVVLNFHACCRFSKGSRRAQRPRFSRNMRTLRNSLPADAPALCGVTITPGMSQHRHFDAIAVGWRELRLRIVGQMHDVGL